MNFISHLVSLDAATTVEDRTFCRDHKIKVLCSPPSPLLAAGTVFHLACSKALLKEPLVLFQKSTTEQNINYLLCSTLRIQAHFAARAAHHPASAPSFSFLPLLFKHSRSVQVAPLPLTKTGWATFNSLLASTPLDTALSPLLHHAVQLPYLFYWPLPQQKQTLQLLDLAQAASDYLKPQPFRFLKNENQTLRRSIATYSNISWYSKGAGKKEGRGG